MTKGRIVVNGIGGKGWADYEIPTGTPAEKVWPLYIYPAFVAARQIAEFAHLQSAEPVCDTETPKLTMN